MPGALGYFCGLVMRFLGAKDSSGDSRDSPDRKHGCKQVRGKSCGIPKSKWISEAGIQHYSRWIRRLTEKGRVNDYKYRRQYPNAHKEIRKEFCEWCNRLRSL